MRQRRSAGLKKRTRVRVDDVSVEQYCSFLHDDRRTGRKSEGCHSLTRAGEGAACIRERDEKVWLLSFFALIKEATKSWQPPSCHDMSMRIDYGRTDVVLCLWLNGVVKAWRRNIAAFYMDFYFICAEGLTLGTMHNTTEDISKLKMFKNYKLQILLA